MAVKFNLFGETEENLSKALQQYVASGEWDKAAEQCAKLIDKFQPDNLSLHLKLAEIYLKAGQRERSLAQYQKVAELYAGMGNEVKVVAVYKAMLNIDPGLSIVRVKLAESHFKQGEIEDAWKQYLLAIKHLESEGLFPQALAILDLMASTPFNDIQKLIKLGEMFRRRNQPEKAVDQFLGVAELFLQQGKIKKAFQAYQQILKIAPSSLEAKKGLDVVKNLVRLQKKEEQQVKAKFGGVYPRQELWQNFSADKLDDILQKLSLSRPQREAPVENLKGHYELGVVYREMHLLDAAVEEFQMASQDPSIRLACYQMLKACYEEKGMSHLADKYQDKISHLH